MREKLFFHTYKIVWRSDTAATRGTACATALQVVPGTTPTPTKPFANLLKITHGPETLRLRLLQGGPNQVFQRARIIPL